MATSPLVPGRLPVAVEDHAYMVEPSGFRRETVQVLRQQADTASEPGEQSLNPQGLWRRSQESWHHGAGQEFLDGKDEKAADPHRFRSSKGIDPWTKGQLSLLHPTLKVWSTTATNLHLASAYAAGAFALYVADGTEVYTSRAPFGQMNTLALLQGTGWTVTNGTISAGTANFSVTSTSAAAPVATSPAGTAGIPVDPGRQYSFFATSVVTTGTGRVLSLAVRWYDAAGATISTSAAVLAGVDTPAGTSISTFATAPATAAYAALILTWTAAWASGDVHRVTAAIGPKDAAGAGPVAPFGSVTVNAGQAAQTVQSLATDGTYVWAAMGTSGLHRILDVATTADVPAAPAGGQISLAGYANGFLLAAGSATSTTGRNTLWLVNDPLGVPTLSVVKTHPNPNFEWTGIGHGRSCVYAWGNSGGNGEVYKVTFDPNTGALSTAASAATFLPDGETVHALQFYAGGIVLGTGRGVRLGQAGGDGNIDYGPLISTDWPVRCLEPQDRYCWFGWTKFDSTSSGLGRIDLGYFTDTLTPAYASDLMPVGTATGDVVSAVSFAPYGYSALQWPPLRVFSVSGQGVYLEDRGSRVASGTLDTGTIRFSTSEPKIARSIDVRHHAMPAGGAVAPSLQADSSGTWVALGSSGVTGSYGPAVPIDTDDTEAEALEFRFVLSRPTPNGADYSATPEMTRWTTKVLPTPSTIDETFTIPLIMRRTVADLNDAAYPVDVPAEIAYLKGLERDRTLVNLQVGGEEHTVYLLGSEFVGQNWAPDKEHMEGVLNTVWQTLRG